MPFWHAGVIPFFIYGGKNMYVMIDNFDSFVYNLKAYFQELGREILVKRCDEITLKAEVI